MEPQADQDGDPLLGTPNRHSDAPLGPRSQGKLSKENSAHGTIIVKIGGSTLADHDTTLQDLVTLQRQGINPVVVHGGGKVITDWMVKQGIRPRFVRGLRVTDPRSLDIVVAVLTGLVNKGLVASLAALGGKAMGLSGADGGMLQAKIQDQELGLVGRVVGVNREPIDAVLGAGCIPIIAPVALSSSQAGADEATLLNVNADTAAGEIAAALGADRLVFLTDVEGVLDSSRRLIPRLTARQARGLMHSNVVAGGMVPKLEACLTALERDSVAQIVDGRKSHALLDSLSGKTMGTRVG